MIGLLPPHPTSRAGTRRLRSVLAASVTALLLAGCVTSRTPPAAMQGSGSDLQSALGYWGERYNRNPADSQAAFAYGRALTASGQRGQAVAVLQKAVVANRRDTLLQAELGKALAANGQFTEAVNVFTLANAPDRPDWRILSAHGAVLDQLGRATEARQLYATAMKISPGEPAILSNLGLSYALTGELQLAERYMREAASSPRADSRVRQNLALILGLQGRFSDAEQIARQELDPARAEQNLAVLRQMLSQPNAWANIQRAPQARGVVPVRTAGTRPAGEPAQKAASGRLPKDDAAAANVPAPASTAPQAQNMPMRLTRG